MSPSPSWATATSRRTPSSSSPTTSSYDLGNGFGHIAVEVDDIAAACDRVREHGGMVTREPGPMKHGTTVIAFVQDPDGYKIEFIQA